ncbi:L-glutamine:2-deoxy-scyllo-inosose aminotransferase [archaeon HR01]|nr:L-glutamine:2-deoxy-scyllo-inosose aminotransferase [archaeon HR01]
MTRLALHGGQPTRLKPFPQWPVFDTDEETEILKVLRSGRWTIGSEKIAEFENAFAAFQQARYGVACSSGSSALLISLKALNVGPGDEVIVPSYTFLATATSVIDSGAKPVFADIDPDTYTVDVRRLEGLITDRTKCVIPVHLGGCPADMDALNNLARRNGLSVLEDAAQAHGAEWRGRRVGAIGDIGAFSFYASKNMTAGEGGFITTNDAELADVARSISNVGRDLKAGWYEHVRYGWNFRMTAFQAAILLSQLRRLPQHMKRREDSARYLDSQLSKIDGVKPLRRPEEVTRHAYHLYIFRINPESFGLDNKEEFVKALKAEGIPCSSGYRPVYSYPFISSRAAGEPVHNINTERAAYHEAVWLPQYVLLAGKEDLDDVVAAIEKIREGG